MKKYLSLLIVVVAVLAGTDCPAQDKAETRARSGLHFDWWGGNDDTSGMQFYIPVQAASSCRNFNVEVLGAYLFTQVNPDDGKRRSLSQATDTKLNFSYGVFDKLPFDLLFGLGFNLPTGHTDLTRSQMVLIVPPDLFSIPTFGEGFNINPTIAVAKEWDSWVTGIGIGYTWKGEYDYNFEIKDYDPGDVFTITGEVRHDFSANILGKLFGQYIHYNKDTVEGDDFYQEGDVKLIGTGLTYSREKWDLAFTITGIFRDKSKLRHGLVLPFATEDRNGHGDELNTGFAYRYRTDSKTALRSSLMYLYIGENDYPSSDVDEHVGKRQKITLGCGIDRILAQNLDGSIGIEGFVMADEENWYHPDEDVTYHGSSISLLVSKKF